MRWVVGRPSVGNQAPRPPVCRLPGPAPSPPLAPGSHATEESGTLPTERCPGTSSSLLVWLGSVSEPQVISEQGRARCSRLGCPKPGAWPPAWQGPCGAPEGRARGASAFKRSVTASAAVSEKPVGRAEKAGGCRPAARWPGASRTAPGVSARGGEEAAGPSCRLPGAESGRGERGRWHPGPPSVRLFQRRWLGVLRRG